MSFGSSISSPLFMQDPVPSGHNKRHKPDIFFTKGNGGEGDSYEHIGGVDDMFVVKVNGASFQLHRKTLKETLSELKSQSNISIRHLSSEHAESFRSIVEALRLLYGSRALYDIILTDILDIFSDVKEVSPGTIAAFFVGCFSDDKFPGPMGCSPKCAASLPPSEGAPGFANCDDLVLIYVDGYFSSLNENHSSHAYIYIENGNGEQSFTGFTDDNFKQLKDTGVENASLVFGKQDGSYSEITSPIAMDELPRKIAPSISSRKEVDTGPAQMTQNTDSTTSTSVTGGVVFAGILIVLVILLVVLLYNAYRP